jgi:hypothetical protein
LNASDGYLHKLHSIGGFPVNSILCCEISAYIACQESLLAMPQSDMVSNLVIMMKQWDA